MSNVKVPDEILDRVNNLIKLAREHIGRNNGNSIPMIHIFKTGNRLDLIGAPLEGRNLEAIEKTKEMLAATIRTLCCNPEVEMVAFLSEAWSLRVESQAEVEQYFREKAQGKWPILSEHPKAVEAAMLAVETPTFRMFGNGVIARDGEKRILKEIIWSQNGEDAQGRFCDFFSKRRAIEAKVRLT